MGPLIGNRALNRIVRSAERPPAIHRQVQRDSQSDSSGGGGAPPVPRDGGGEGHAPHLTVEDVRALPSDEKAQAISNMLDGSASVHVAAECWSTFGDEVAAARQYRTVFERLIKAAPSVLDHAPFAALKTKFERDVEDQARKNLYKNKQTVLKERERTGAGLDPAQAGADQDFEVQETQKAAVEMQRLKEAKEKIQQIKIAHRTKPLSEGGGVRLVGPFNPGGPVFPEYEQDPAYPTWNQVNEQWMKATATEAALIRRHPSTTFFMGKQGDPKALQAADIKEARAMIATALTDLEAKIDKATPLVGDDLTFIDFPPIQNALMNGGSPAVSGTIWSKPLERSIAASAIKDANFSHLLATLALGTAAAAAFICAELATGGLATFLFIASATAGAGQAAKSWDHYADLATAQAASINPEIELVSGEQVDSAMTSAIIDTVFAAIDVFQAAKGGYTAIKGGSAVLEAGKEGAKGGARVALKNLAKETNKADVILKGLAELGPAETRKAANMSFEQLAEIVGKDSAAGKTFTKWAEMGAEAAAEAQTLAAKLPQLKSLPADQRALVLQASIEVNGIVGTLKKGGGWKTIMALGVGESAAAKQMEAWRAGLVNEMQAFISKESENLSKVARTGTAKASSDLDVQVLGGTAAELQQKAEGWLAGRIGTDVPGAKKLLDAEIFVDPTRAHLFDIMAGLSPEVRGQIASRCATYEKQMIFGARLREAEKAGEAAVEKVMAEARDAGVEPFKGFVKLGAEEQTNIAKQIDVWMKELETTTDASRKADLVEKVSKAQATINASHPDAYVGGGVKVWVTGRGGSDTEAIAKALGIDPKALTSVTDTQRVVSALSEGKWMDAASKQLKAGGTTEELAKAIKDLGKHGSRAAEKLGVKGKTDYETLSGLANKLMKYKAEFEAGTLVKNIERGELERYRSELSSLMGQLRSESTTAVKTLERDAKALNIPEAEMAEFQGWLRWEAHYTASAAKTAELATKEIDLWIKAITTAGKGANASQSGTDPEPNQSVPGPNQSTQ
jgi:hypothetical protein